MTENYKFDSFAVYASDTSINTAEGLLLDLNLWINRSQGCDLDFGIVVPASAGSGFLNIFIPFVLSKEQVIDLSDSLLSPTIKQMVFNGRLDGRSDSRHKKWSDTPIDGVCIKPIGWRTDAEMSYPPGGSMLRIHFDAEGCPGALYYRFRIPYPDLDSAIKATGDLKETITSPIVPFRAFGFIELNQIRGLPCEIIDELLKSTRLLDGVKLILVADKDWNVEAWSTPYKVRALESDFWRDYQPKIVPKKMKKTPCRSTSVVYQWEGTPDSPTFQFSLSRKALTIKTLLLYLAILAVLDLLSNRLVDVISGSLSILIESLI